MRLSDEDDLKEVAFSSALHGRPIADNGGITALRKKDPKAHKIAVDEYFQHWGNTTACDESQDARLVRKLMPLDPLLVPIC